MQSDKIKKYIDDLLVHKQYMLESCNKMVKWLLNNNQEVLAIELVERAIIHDNSKFTDEEMDALGKLYETKEPLVNPDHILEDSDKDLIRTHWKNNRHHPEYFDKITDMMEIDIIEMVCDWYARSNQFGTDLMEFVHKRQENRFHFPNEIYRKVIKYCNIMINN